MPDGITGAEGCVVMLGATEDTAGDGTTGSADDEPDDTAGAEGCVDVLGVVEETAGSDSETSDDTSGTEGCVDVLRVTEDTAGDDTAGFDGIVESDDDGAGFSDDEKTPDIVDGAAETTGAEGEGASELCCGSSGPTGPPPVQEA